MITYLILVTAALILSCLIWLFKNSINLDDKEMDELERELKEDIRLNRPTKWNFKPTIIKPNK